MRILLSLLFVVALNSSATVLDRVVVVVEEQVVLESDVRLEEELLYRDASTSPFWHRNRAKPTERLIEGAILRHLAGDVAIYQPSPDDVRSRVEEIRMRFDNRASWIVFLDTWGLDEVSLRAVVRRRMVAERYLGRNLQVDTSDREIWMAAADDFFARIRPTLRIRMIEPQKKAN